MYWKIVNKKEWDEVKRLLTSQEKLIEEVNEAIYQIEKGNLSLKLSEQISNTKLANSLQNMIDYLSKVREDEEGRSWFASGLSFFLELIRNKEEQPFDVLINRCLAELIKIVNANQGAIFILNENPPDEAHIEMVACYAYNRKKYLNKRQSVGEGLAGQSILEKDSIYLKSVPPDYLQITSGLGEAAPKNIFITPLLINDSVLGVIELASFYEFKPRQLDFIKKVAENLASLIRNGKEKERMEEVLLKSQQQTENLRSQEEEMRQNLEEMTALQEQLARNENELKKQLAEMEAALLNEKKNEIAKIKEEENKLLESKLEAQRISYELIIEKLKERLKQYTSTK
jgi:methyl-accepting chemotaxis protein